MTSPVGGKPSYEGAGYEQVHSEGSGFGQDLREDTVRSMLMGQAKSPFQEAADNFFDFVGNVGIALGNAVGRLFPDINILPLPPLYEQFTDEAFKALEPLHSMADEAIEKAGTAQDRAEQLSDDLESSVTDMSDKINLYSETVDDVEQLAQNLHGQVTDSEGVIQSALVDMEQARADVVAAGEAYSLKVQEAESLALQMESTNSDYSAKVAAAEQAARDLEAAQTAYAAEVAEAERLAGEMDATSDEYAATVAEVGLLATRVENATQAYSSAVAEADHLAGEISSAVDAYASKVSEAEGIAVRVESAATDYAGKVTEAAQLLADTQAAKDDAEDAAQEVATTVGSPEFQQAVADFAFFQSELNNEQSDFNQGVQASLDALDMVASEQSDFNVGVTTALSALEMVQDETSDFNKGVAEALRAQEMVNNDQSDFNQGVQASLGALEMVSNTQSEFNQGVTHAMSALQMVQDQTSDFNKGVADALAAQEMVNNDQSEFNLGVTAALDVLDMVQDAQSDFNQGVQTSIDALDEFQSEQSNYNLAVSLALAAQQDVNDFNNINWQTQADYNHQNNIINRAQNEALMLHENELTMMDDARPRAWVFYTSQMHERAPWIAVRIYDRSILSVSTVDLTALGTWAGRVMVSISFYDQGTGSESAVDQYDWLVVPGDPSERTTTFEAGARHMGIRNVAVTLYPFWGTRKREFLLKPYEFGTSSGLALQHTEAYVNDLEGNPLEWGGQGSVRLPSRTVDMFGTVVTSPAKAVVANQGTYVHSTVDGNYHYTPAGTTIPADAWIRSETDNLLALTEV